MCVVREDAAVRGASLRTIVDTAVRHSGGSKDKALDAGGRQGRRSQVGARRHPPRHSPVGRSLVLVLVGLLGCAIVPHSLPLHAAKESVLTAARVCAELDWREKGGFERAAPTARPCSASGTPMFALPLATVPARRSSSNSLSGSTNWKRRITGAGTSAAFGSN